jgi:8-oxo-dGTP diphosphatase
MKTIEVCAAVIIKNSKVLLTSRPDHQEHAGFWEFPGGKLEPGETPAECLIREIREELAVDITVYDTIFFIDHTYPGKKVRIRFIRCAIIGEKEPSPQEGQDFAWVERHRLNDVDLLPADQPVAEFLGA